MPDITALHEKEFNSTLMFDICGLKRVTSTVFVYLFIYSFVYLFIYLFIYLLFIYLLFITIYLMLTFVIYKWIMIT